MGSKKVQEQGNRGAEEEEDAGTRGRADAGSCRTHRSPHRDLKGWRGPRTPCPCLRVIPSPRQSRRDSPHLGTWAPLHRHLSTWAPGTSAQNTSSLLTPHFPLSASSLLCVCRVRSEGTYAPTGCLTRDLAASMIASASIWAAWRSSSGLPEPGISRTASLTRLSFAPW